jgi:hypothetical protein
MRMTSILTSSAVLSAALLLASSDSIPAQDIVFRDSGVVRIANVRRLDTLRRSNELKTTLVAEIGGSARGEQYEFTNPFRGFILANGGVALSSRNDIRFFDAKGNWIRSLGRKGSGPGEFNSINMMCGFKDGSLLTHDGSRYTLFDKTGTVQWLAKSATSLKACLPDNSLLVYTGIRSTALPPLGTELAARVQADPGASLSRYSLISMEETPRFLHDIAVFRSYAIGRATSRVTVNGTRALIAASKPLQASPTATESGDRVCVGEAIAFEVRCHSTTSDSLFILRIDRAPRRVTEEHKRAYLEQFKTILAPEELEPHSREIDKVGYPATLAPYATIKGDDLGRIWIRDLLPGEKEQQWNVFRGTGEHIGTLHFPNDLTVIQIRYGRILALTQDAEGFYIAKIFALGSH